MAHLHTAEIREAGKRRKAAAEPFIKIGLGRSAAVRAANGELEHRSDGLPLDIRAMVSIIEARDGHALSDENYASVVKSVAHLYNVMDSEPSLKGRYEKSAHVVGTAAHLASKAAAAHYNSAGGEDCPVSEGDLRSMTPDQTYDFLAGELARVRATMPEAVLVELAAERECMAQRDRDRDAELARLRSEKQAHNDRWRVSQ